MTTHIQNLRNALLIEHDNNWKDCTKCRLCTFRRNMVLSYGNPTAQLMFISAGPSAEDDYHASPLVGPSGEALDIMLANMNMTREDVFISQLVACHPMTEQGDKTRVPRQDEISACLPRLYEEIRIVDPDVLVLLGDVPVRALVPGKKSKMSSLLGKLLQVPVPTNHPQLPDALYPAVPMYDLEQLLKMDAAGINLLSGAGQQTWAVNGVAVQCTDHLRAALRTSDLLRYLRENPERGLEPNPPLPDRGISVAV